MQLEHVQWRAPEFLLALPNGQLASRAVALEYFSLSPFFDKASSNAQLAMQVMFSRGGSLHGVDLEPDLARFTGVEFVVADRLSHPPDLYVVLKRHRSSPTHTVVLAAYHILNGNVYQAPSLFNVLNERLVRSLRRPVAPRNSRLPLPLLTLAPEPAQQLTATHALSTAFTALTELKPAWTRERQYAWDIKPPPPSAAAATALLTDKGPNPNPDGRGPPPKSTSPPPTEGEHRLAGEGDPKEDKEGEEEEEEEEAERPGDEFNPLLFRALQAVAARTEAEAIVAYRAEQQAAHAGETGGPGERGTREDEVKTAAAPA